MRFIFWSVTGVGVAHARLTLMRVKASQLRTSARAGWSILWTRAWTIFPPAVLYGRPMISHSPVLSSNRSPTWRCIGRTVRVAGCSGSRFFAGRRATAS